MNHFERWLDDNFERQVRIYPSETLRTEYVKYRAKKPVVPRFVPQAVRYFSPRRVIWVATAWVVALLPWLLPVLLIWS